jgi:Domain of unknown function (DUF5658)
MRRVLISSLSMLLITGSSVLAADENTTPATKSSALTIVLPVAEAQQASVGSGIGTSAGASVIKPAPAPSTRPLALPALYATAVGLQVFDVYSTLSALHLGGVEQNPLMKGVVGSPAALVATKATVTVASIAAAERLWRNNRRMGAIGLMVASNVMLGIVASHNSSVLSSLK